MNINRMTEEELAKQLQEEYMELYGKHKGEGNSWLDVAKFVRQSLKDSVPEELSKEKLALCVSEATSWFPETPNVLKSVCIETLAEAIHTALYGNTKPDERKEEGKDRHVA